MENKTLSRIWNPTEDQLFHTYRDLKDSQRLEVWYSVKNKNYESKRCKIEIPAGLEYLREFKSSETKGFEYLEIVLASFKDFDNKLIFNLNVFDILCIRVLDEWIENENKGVISQNTSERKNETIELFNKIKPLLDAGSIYTTALMEVTNRKRRPSKNDGWVKDVIEYGETQGYPYAEYSHRKSYNKR